MKKISILVPCYNEEKGIASVIKAVPTEKLKQFGFAAEVIVIDNNSTDKTAEICRTLGVRVVFEGKKGKGNAMRTGFRSISNDTDFVVMVDGDNTYKPAEIGRLIEPLNSGFCDVVLGSRLGGRISEGSMTMFNRLGNWVYSHLVRYFYGVNVTDVLTGYFAWKREVVERLLPHLESSGFAIEMEMVIKMARTNEEIYSVPISYDKRAGTTNLRPIYDGVRILWMFCKNLTWSPDEKKITLPAPDPKGDFSFKNINA